jgi:hypothetical protein
VAAKNVIATIALLSASESSSSREVRLGIGGDLNLGTRNNPVLEPLEDIVKGAVGIVNLAALAAEQVPSGKKLVLINAPDSLSQLRDVGVRGCAAAGHQTGFEVRGTAIGRWFLRLNGKHREEEPSSQHRHSRGRLHTLVFHAGQNSKTPLPVDPDDFRGARSGNIGDAQKASLRI